MGEFLAVTKSTLSGKEGSKVFEGQISSLKHFKDDVREVASGLEGGVVLDGFQDFREGDTLEAHLTVLAQ